MLLVSLSVDMRNWIYSKRKRFQRQIVEIYCLVLIFDAKVLNYAKRIYTKCTKNFRRCNILRFLVHFRRYLVLF